MAQRNRNDEAPASGFEETVESLGYPAIRKNIPPVGSPSHGVVKDVPAMQQAFNPYLAPDLKSPPDAHGVDGLCDRVQWIIAESRARSLECDEADVLSEALRQFQPWLESSGEREKSWIVVNPVASHVHERVLTEAFFPARKRWNQLPKAFDNQEGLMRACSMGCAVTESCRSRLRQRGSPIRTGRLRSRRLILVVATDYVWSMEGN